LKPAPTSKPPELPEIVRAFKTFSNRRINQIRGTTGAPFWPHGYYEHVIRNESELKTVYGNTSYGIFLAGLWTVRTINVNVRIK